MTTTQQARSPTARRTSLLLLLVILSLQVAHFVLLLCFRHAVVGSNDFQLLCASIATLVCIRQCRAASDVAERLRWLAVCFAFGIWSAAELWLLILMQRPSGQGSALPFDNALWVLFGLPLLLVNYCSGEGKDEVRLLDRAQATLFFAVLYLLVFLPPVQLGFDAAFDLQNLALILCGLLRLPTCTSAPERRFYVRLNFFLIAYGICSYAGFALYARGWPEGSIVDGLWTLPMTFFVILVLRDELRPPRNQDESGLMVAARTMQGLGITILAFASVAVSVVFAHQNLVGGGVMVVLAFGLFAFRLTLRERAFHRDHCRLQEAVLRDILTGLGNRILLQNTLSERLSLVGSGRTTVVLFLDLDRFKSVNDSLGHAMGDRLLVEIGSRLRLASPADSVVCRPGGDEFVIVTSVAQTAEAEAIGDVLLEALGRPLRLGPHTLRCTASIGVVQANPGTSLEDLLRMADHAMYHAKALGKARVQVFDTSLFAKLTSRWQLEADLRVAVENEGVAVSFQPIALARDGTLVGVEALARWSHPQWGQIPPSEFIPLAENAGLILQLGRQVLHNACQQVASWNQVWGRHLTVNVNVSPLQFTDPGFLQEVISVLEQTGLESHLLHLEITESALLLNQEAVSQVLEDARRQGIRVALDDFGTGYSSLSLLMKLPVDEVKIDKSFVFEMHRDTQKRELVRTVSSLAHSLGKCVVAEGVETEQDFGELLGMGCEYIQGWLVSPPLGAAAFEEEHLAVESRFVASVSRLQEDRVPALEIDNRSINSRTQAAYAL